MKKFKRIIASFIMAVSLLAINPVVAHAEWKQSGNNWWYSQGGSSYAIGWTQIEGKWYYFDSNGYLKNGWLYDSGNWFYFYGNGQMAHDTTIDGYYLNSGGAWTTNIPVQNTYISGNSNANTGSGLTNNQSQTVYITATGSKYHRIPKCGNSKYVSSTTLEKAKKQGYTACSKCY